MPTLTDSQRSAARLAGLMYLTLLVLAFVAEFYIRGQLIAYDDIAKTAKNILDAQTMFRFGIVCDLIGGAGNALLAVMLYVLLKPVNSGLALLAAFWRLGESVILGLAALNSMTVLQLLGGASYLHAFSTEQLHALARLSISTQAATYDIGLVFFSLGSSCFCYLLFRSRFVPRVLAVWGIIGSLLALVGTLIVIVFPHYGFIKPDCYLPVWFFEIAIGMWLLTRGVRQHKWYDPMPRNVADAVIADANKPKTGTNG